MRHRERGVTLVELMVTVVILGIVVAAIFGSMFTVSNLAGNQTRVISAQSAGRFSVNLIGSDLMSAGYGMPKKCDTDLRVVDKEISCQVGGGAEWAQAVHIKKDHSILKSDELWIMTNPVPGVRLAVTGQSGGTLSIAQGDAPTALFTEVLTNYPIMVIDARTVLSLRNKGTVTAGSGDTPWEITFDPPPAVAIGEEVRGFGPQDMLVSPVVWIRYYVDPNSHYLYRDVMKEPPTQGVPVAIAENVAELDVSYCVDRSDNSSLQPPLKCDDVEGDLNENPERLRTMTITVRTYEDFEDSTFKPTPEDDPETYFDIDNDPTNGVAHVRSYSRTFTTWNMGI